MEAALKSLSTGALDGSTVLCFMNIKALDSLDIRVRPDIEAGFKFIHNLHFPEILSVFLTNITLFSNSKYLNIPLSNQVSLLTGLAILKMNLSLFLSCIAIMRRKDLASGNTKGPIFVPFRYVSK